MVLDGKSSQEYPVIAALFLVLHFFCFTLMNFLTMLTVVLLSMLMILLFILSVTRYLICGNNLNWLVNLNLIYETLWTGVRNDLLISLLGKLSWFHLTGLITMVLLMWKWMGLFARCPCVLEILKMSWNFVLSWNLSWNLRFSEFCSGNVQEFFCNSSPFFLVIISVRVPSTLKNLENSLVSLILFDNLTLDFLCL